jgi:hypothetical protein
MVITAISAYPKAVRLGSLESVLAFQSDGSFNQQQAVPAVR